MARVPSPAAAHIGARLAAARHDWGLTQDELGVLSSIDSANVRAYENGRSLPSIHSLMRLAWALEVPPGEMLDGLTPAHFGTDREQPGRRAAG